MAAMSNNIHQKAVGTVEKVDDNLEKRTPESGQLQLSLALDKSSMKRSYNHVNGGSKSNIFNIDLGSEPVLLTQGLHGRKTALLSTELDHNGGRRTSYFGTSAHTLILESGRQSKVNKSLEDVLSLNIVPRNDKGVAERRLPGVDVINSPMSSVVSSSSLSYGTESRAGYFSDSITSVCVSDEENEGQVLESVKALSSKNSVAPQLLSDIESQSDPEAKFQASQATDHSSVGNEDLATHRSDTLASYDIAETSRGSNTDPNHKSRIIDTSPPSGLVLSSVLDSRPVAELIPLTPYHHIKPPPGAPESPLPPVSPLISPPELAPNSASTPRFLGVPRDADESPSRSHWRPFSRKQGTIVDKPVAVVTSADLPAVILPSPPTDAEKFCYAQTRRVPLYAFGTFSFLSVSVGMWFFVISSVDFYWFGLFSGLIQIYLIISYVVGYCGRDFDIAAHQKLIEENPLTVEPSVDIYLPCCKEPLEVLENTYKYVSNLDYYNLKVYVLDDGGLGTVKRLADQYNFNYISRDDKPKLKKAGNLRWAFARTSSEFFVIFDADFCPRADFLKTILPYMRKEEDLAIIQSPQFFRPSSEQTWVEQGASATQELFYRVVQVNRDRWGAAICVGSNAMYRRKSLVEVGGTAEIGHSEDVHTGFYAVNRGWRLKYLPIALACGVSPDTPKAFFSQQMRWCSGSTTLLTNLDFWKSKLSLIQKICYLSGMMYYSAASLMIFLNPIPGILMISIDPKRVMFYNCAYAFPSLIYSILVFRLWSRQRYNFNVNFVFVIQQYAFLMAIKDRLLGTTANWVPSGDNSGHGGGKKKAGGNNKYRNMRILCCVWMFGSASGMITATTLRILGGYTWYHFLPQLLLEAYNLFVTHRFMFYSH